MNTTLISKIEQSYLKKAPELKPGDTVRVHQKIKEGNKERIQVFEGVVLRVKGGGLRTSFIVRKLSFGIGVEKCFLLHSPNIAKIEIKKRAKVRRAYLTYLRALRGKKARLKDMQFDVLSVNVTEEPEVEEIPEVSAEAQTEDEKIDASITELDAEEMEEPTGEVSLDEIVKEENREAAEDGGDDEYTGVEAEDGTNEAEVVGEEFAEGVAQADKDAETGKATEGMRAEGAAEELTPEQVADEVKQDREADNE